MLPFSGQRLVALLGVHDRPLRRSYVAGTLWLDSSEERAGASLRSALWRVNRPGLRVVEATTNEVGLAADVRVDLRETTTLARDVLDATLDVTGVGGWQAGLTRDLLPDWYDDWLIVERERFRQLRLHALESLCSQLVAAGRFAEAVEAGMAAVAGEPLRESAHRTLIEAFLAESNLNEAVRQFRECRRLLWAELGVEPSPRLQRLVPSAGTAVGGG
jgi:DNA-binding SARP family transcriptional activator